MEVLVSDKDKEPWIGAILLIIGGSAIVWVLADTHDAPQMGVAHAGALFISGIVFVSGLVIKVGTYVVAKLQPTLQQNGTTLARLAEAASSSRPRLPRADTADIKRESVAIAYVAAARKRYGRQRR